MNSNIGGQHSWIVAWEEYRTIYILIQENNEENINNLIYSPHENKNINFEDYKKLKNHYKMINKKINITIEKEKEIKENFKLIESFNLKSITDIMFLI